MDGYWKDCYTQKKEVIAFIKEIVGENFISLREQEMSVVAIDHHSCEPVSGKVVEISRNGFVLEYNNLCLPWTDMILEDLCCISDFLVEMMLVK